jgi:Fe-S cluster assembly ATP-binding protein
MLWVLYVELSSMLLEVRDLEVDVGGREVLRGVNLSMGESEIHFLLGPNAAGKTTLLSAIAGVPRVSVKRGKILFDGKDVTFTPLDERARLGIALAYQLPPELVGVSLRSLARLLSDRFNTAPYMEKLAKMLDLEHLLDRESFRGFSGGERKRAELFLISLMRPRLALLDEPDSGVDIDSLNLIAEAIRFINKEFGSSILIVTHTRLLMEKVEAQKAHVLCNGGIVLASSPRGVLEVVEKTGYKGLCGEGEEND